MVVVHFFRLLAKLGVSGRLPPMNAQVKRSPLSRYSSICCAFENPRFWGDGLPASEQVLEIEVTNQTINSNRSSWAACHDRDSNSNSSADRQLITSVGSLVSHTESAALTGIRCVCDLFVQVDLPRESEAGFPQGF